MILLYTDFGAHDIYVGQVKAQLLQYAPEAAIIDLLHDAPKFAVRPNAHLLAALHDYLPSGAVIMAVVDPGVGGKRLPVVVEADGRWYVGPDNGLLSVIVARAQTVQCWRIDWRPERLSPSFHGRDLFAPIAAMIERQELWAGALSKLASLEVSLGAKELAEVIYVDHYGNVMTALRAIPESAIVEAGEQQLRYARTFSEVATGEVFWYRNSLGLVELAMNCGSAAKRLGLKLGNPVRVCG